MRLVLGIAAVAVLSACGGKDDAAGPVVADKAAPAMENAAPATPAPGPPAPSAADTAASAAAAQALQLNCGAPFTPDATPATLAAVFGKENVIPETIDGPEGEPLNVTAIYPKDLTKRIEVTFKDEEARTGLTSVTVREIGSKWAGPGGFHMKAKLDEIEKLNGGPVRIAGFDWDYGGYVVDWKGGKLGETPALKCRAMVRFEHETVRVADAIIGEGGHDSTEAAMRAAKPTVAMFGISWNN